MEQDSPYDPNTSSTFLTHWPLVFLEGKVASFEISFPIFLVHCLPFIPAEILSKQLPLQRLFSSCFAFSLLALPPPIPTLPNGLLKSGMGQV